MNIAIKPFYGKYTNSKNWIFSLLIGIPIGFFVLYIQQWGMIIFPFIPITHIDLFIGSSAILILQLGYFAETGTSLPFGFYKDHNNAYRFGQIVGIIVLKITAVLIADALLIYLLIKYWNMMIYSIFSVIGLIVSAYASFRIMVKLLLDFKDYLEINTDYIEWYDVQAEAIDENYFFRKPLKKGFKIHLKLTEIVAVIPIIKERERDDKGKKIDVKEFIKFKFNLITGSSTELNLAAISQIPNSDAVYDALHSVLGNKLKAIKEAGEEKE